jgi:hypothetical protein
MVSITRAEVLFMDYFEHLKKIHDAKLHRDEFVKEKTEKFRVVRNYAFIGSVVLAILCALFLHFGMVQLSGDTLSLAIMTFLLSGAAHLNYAGTMRRLAVSRFGEDFPIEAKIIKEDEEFQATLKKLNALKK